MSASSSADTPFRFENFKTSESLTDALWQQHPRGTASSRLLETLKEAGAKCGQPKPANDATGRVIKTETYCSYRYSPNGLSAITWTILFTSNADGQLTNIAGSYYLT